jgi:hypothetical protein
MINSLSHRIYNYNKKNNYLYVFDKYIFIYFIT